MTSGHWPDCRCSLCLDFSRGCCGRVFTQYTAFRKHLKSKLHRDAKPRSQPRDPKRKTQLVIIPDGLGYLISATSTPERLQTISLAAVSRFAAALNDTRHFRQQRFTKSERDTLKRLLGGDEEAVTTTVPLTAQQAIAVFQLAQGANIPAKAVSSLLVSYGLEHLANELRTNHVAPTPKDPTTIVREAKQKPTIREEFLMENGVPVHERTTEIKEYRTPVHNNELYAKSEDVGSVSIPGIPSAAPTVESKKLDMQPMDSREQNTGAPVPTKRFDAKRYIPRAE